MTIRQKIEEISLALIKVSVAARRNEFRQRLEHLSFTLLDSLGEEDYQKLLREIEKTKIFVDFGRLIYEIEPINARVILEECSNVSTNIHKSSGFDGKVDITGIFSRNESLDSLKEHNPHNGKGPQSIQKKNLSIKITKKNNPAIGEDNPAIINPATETLESPAMLNNPAIDQGESTIRQSAIVDRIRQSGNQEVQFKDIIAAFSGVSERTIRYDLQKLCSQGILERTGAGGPSTYYKIRQI